MPSLIPGYEYDIFISYRHKDNKYVAVIEKQQRDREEIRRVIELQKVQQELKLILR